MHPCPCGFAGDPVKEYRCNPAAIARYQKRISGPLLDRIDIHLDVPRIEGASEPRAGRRTAMSPATYARLDEIRRREAPAAPPSSSAPSPTPDPLVPTPTPRPGGTGNVK